VRADGAGDEAGRVPWWGRLASYAQHGPLPPLLTGLTVVTGIVDAVSYVALGHVFVANQTGNVVLLGFALAGAPGLSMLASLLAMASFVVGAALGGRLGRRVAHHRGALLRTGTAAATVLLVTSFLFAFGAAEPVEGPRRYFVLTTLALAMGVQTSVARRLAVPDMSTTVVTMTLTGLAADTGPAARAGARRAVVVVAMFAGALVGALLTLRAGPAAALALALATTAAVAAGAHRTARSPAPWATR
jgi:uncharacterized membrane protein YoaK (UPF0700 family)